MLTPYSILYYKKASTAQFHTNNNNKNLDKFYTKKTSTLG